MCVLLYVYHEVRACLLGSKCKAENPTLMLLSMNIVLLFITGDVNVLLLLSVIEKMSCIFWLVMDNSFINSVLHLSRNSPIP